MPSIRASEIPKQLKIKEVASLSVKVESEDQWTPIESPGTSAYHLGPLTFHQGAMSIRQRANSNSCLLKLERKAYKLQLSAFYGSDATMTIFVVCLAKASCSFDSDNGDQGIQTAQEFPLAKCSDRVTHLRLVVSSLLTRWETIGGRLPADIEMLRLQLMANPGRNWSVDPSTLWNSKASKSANASF